MTDDDCWQIDATHWQLADGTTVEIIDIIDDHSRVCPAAVAMATCRSIGAWHTFILAGSVWGLPARVLSDNGLTFNGSRRKVTVTFEANLRAAGVSPIVSTPGHPQTCGKVERFHQTLKKWSFKLRNIDSVLRCGRLESASEQCRSVARRLDRMSESDRKSAVDAAVARLRAGGPRDDRHWAPGRQPTAHE